MIRILITAAIFLTISSYAQELKYSKEVSQKIQEHIITISKQGLCKGYKITYTKEQETYIPIDCYSTLWYPTIDEKNNISQASYRAVHYDYLNVIVKNSPILDKVNLQLLGLEINDQFEPTPSKAPEDIEYSQNYLEKHPNTTFSYSDYPYHHLFNVISSLSLEYNIHVEKAVQLLEEFLNDDEMKLKMISRLTAKHTISVDQAKEMGLLDNTYP